MTDVSKPSASFPTYGDTPLTYSYPDPTPPQPTMPRDEAAFRRRPASPIPSIVLESFPNLKVLEGVLCVEDLDQPQMRRHVADLALLPQNVLQLLKEVGIKEIHIADRYMPELDSNQAFKGVHPRGWPPGATWDSVPGTFNPTNLSVVAGHGEHGSASALLHETGHALGFLMGFDNHPDLIAAHKRLYPKLSPYLQQGGPGALAGRQELLAEGIAYLLKYGDAAMTAQYDEGFTTFLRQVALNPDKRAIRRAKIRAFGLSLRARISSFFASVRPTPKGN